MLKPDPAASCENRLLSILPAHELAELEPALEHVQLAFQQVLHEWEQPVSHLWFPCRGVGSIVSTMADGSSVEVATVGREGMVGLSAVLGARHLAQRVFVQVPGDSFRLPVERYAELQAKLPVLGRVLLRYAAALVTQIAQGSACNRLHEIEARCARWLLMTHDRVDGDSFRMTHEFLAQMLGVTRPSVTIAAGFLQRAGMIHYSRGEVSILDRARLEEASCECYGVITGEFRRLLTPDRAA
jgi:CRP-like cAMP-binding protein